MKKSNYNYEEHILDLNKVQFLIDESVRYKKPLSLARFGHGELAYLCYELFPEWIKGFSPHILYAGATTSPSIIKNDLIKALKTADIVGFHTSWNKAWEDRKSAEMTQVLINHLDLLPKKVCNAFITHEMIKSKKFWGILKNRRIALVGRRAAEASTIFKKKGIKITQFSELEGYKDIEKVHNDLVRKKDWDIALLSAGIPATILAPLLANRTNRVVIDFGHAMDRIIDNENFDYQKILNEWNDKPNIAVSFIMAVYNGETFLREAIESALAQTYKNNEIIIINDGSTDSSREIIESYRDERIRAIHSKKNMGAANALNTGVEYAKGDWIAIQDADDNSYPNRIQEQVNYIKKHPELVAVGTMVECIAGSPDITKNMLTGIMKFRNSYLSRKAIRGVMYWGCPLTHSSVLISKEAFLKVGGYNTEFKIAYDYDLWLRLIEKGDIESIPKILLQYRIHKVSLSNKNNDHTVNEIQIASSKAIFRFLNRNNIYKPRVVVIGPRFSCENYLKSVAPFTGLTVNNLMSKERWSLHITREVYNLKKGIIHAIIILDHYNKERILNYLKKTGLLLNKHYFNIYNTFWY